MASREIFLEWLLEKQGFDATGEAVGRIEEVIEEVIAEQPGEEWVIQEYLIGLPAVLERLSAWTLALKILHGLGARKLYGGNRIPWDKLELTECDRPRLRCSLQELEKISRRAIPFGIAIALAGMATLTLHARQTII